MNRESSIVGRGEAVFTADLDSRFTGSTAWFVVRLTAAALLDDATQRRLRAALGGRAQVTAVGLSVRAPGREFSEQAAVLCEVLATVGRISAQAVPVTAAPG